MARRLRYLILAALLICLGAGLSYSIVRGHLLKRPDRLLEEAARLVDLRLENIDYTQITEGRREWSLKATHVDFKEKDDLFTLEDVSLILYQKSNHHLKIEGDRGLYNRKDRWIKVMGREDTLGTIEEKKLADMIAVDGDPLDDITVLQDTDRIKLVLTGGKDVKNTL